MIIVKRLTGQPFAVNPDLIERIECTPDTILVLLDGTRYLVDESLPGIVSLIQEHRAAIVARSLDISATQHAAERAEERGGVVVELVPRPHGGP